eukprot:7528209-Alexandrium_andersonii.AAC.1
MHPAEASGTDFEAVPGSRSSSSERLKRVCSFRMADCGLRRVAAPAGLDRIPDRTSDTVHWKDPRERQAEQ